MFNNFIFMRLFLSEAYALAMGVTLKKMDLL